MSLSNLEVNGLYIHQSRTITTGVSTFTVTLTPVARSTISGGRAVVGSPIIALLRAFSNLFFSWVFSRSPRCHRDGRVSWTRPSGHTTVS
ncbi:hypothetical protein BDW42DRAFT_51867 [Aspergillus taichungensis]|uniref:Uncharacterized protein n=1 Tax=Aspergillus taichungensis TaxID=482145 RepID=A0A2J5HDC7_9EURO|nr:hypothetical protein BDW42DRAFT_51867 [Aspergillus taichungensis]